MLVTVIKLSLRELNNLPVQVTSLIPGRAGIKIQLSKAITYFPCTEFPFLPNFAITDTDIS